MDAVPYEMGKTPTVNIALSGATVDQIMILLNNPLVFCRTTTGALHGFVDPLPIIAILREAIQTEMQRRGIPFPNGAIPEAPTRN